MKNKKYYTFTFQVPCARAKPKKDGSYGDHDVTVVLCTSVSPAGLNVAHIHSVSCECEKTEDPATLEFFVDFKEKRYNVCYFYPLMIKSKFDWGRKFDYGSFSEDTKLLKKFTPFISESVSGAMANARYSMENRKYNKVVVSSPASWNNFYVKLARKITGCAGHNITTSLGLPKEYFFNGEKVAVINEQGSWVLTNGYKLADGVLTSSITTTRVYNTPLHDGRDLNIKESKYCSICWQAYNKYQDHNSTLGHKKNCTEVILQALKVTSKKGLLKYKKDGPKAFYSKRQIKNGMFGGLEKRATLTEVQNKKKEFFDLGMHKFYAETLAQQNTAPLPLIEAIIEERRKNILNGQK